jgi:CubicO group peptidase (beta-lactamase class C family)
MVEGSQASIVRALDVAARDAKTRGRVAGAVMGIRDATGKQVVRCLGVADAVAPTRVSRSTKFAIGSVSKQFTAAAIAKLAEEGRLSLQDELGSHLRLRSSGLTGILIGHLLSHTAGLGELADPQMLREPARSQSLTPERVLRIALDAAPLSRPGASWFYSNTGYYLLGLVVEAVSGMTYAEYLQAAVLDRAGFYRTTVAPDSADHAKGYTCDGGLLREVDRPSPGQTFGSGGLWSTADDLLEWQALLHAGRIVKGTSVARMTQITSLRDGMLVGYGAGLYVLTRDGHPEVSHHGRVGAFASQLSYYPEPGLGTVVLTTGDAEEAERLSEVIRGMILGIKAMPSESCRSPETSAYVGCYTHGSSRLSVGACSDVLVMETPAGEQIELSFRGNAEFEFVKQRGMRVQFVVERGVALHYVVTRYGRPLAIGSRV